MVVESTEHVSDVGSRIRAIVVIVVVTGGAFSLAGVFSVIPMLFTTDLEAELSTGLFIASTVLSFVGMGLGGWMYLKWSDKGLSYIAIEYPDKGSVVQTIVVFTGCITLLLVGGVLSSVFNIPVGESSLINELRGDRVAILLMIGVVFLFNAPAEEFLFRGILQERLSEVFDVKNSIVISSVVFAVVHVPGYLYIVSPTEMIYPMVMIFSASVILGIGYWYTKNIVVVIGAHGLYNAVQIITLLF